MALLHLPRLLPDEKVPVPSDLLAGISVSIGFEVTIRFARASGNRSDVDHRSDHAPLYFLQGCAAQLFRIFELAEEALERGRRHIASHAFQP